MKIYSTQIDLIYLYKISFDYTHTLQCAHKLTHIHMHMHTYTHTHIQTHTYIRTQTHTHTHRHIDTQTD